MWIGEESRYQRFSHPLFNIPFIICTDYDTLEYLVGRGCVCVTPETFECREGFLLGLSADKY